MSGDSTDGTDGAESDGNSRATSDGLLSGVPRTVLVGGISLLVLVVVVVGAGVVFLSGGGAVGAVQNVPEDADTVMYVDASVQNDELTRKLVDMGLRETIQPGEDVESARESFEEQTGLDPQQVTRIVAFSETPDNVGSEYGGAIVRADWDETDVIDGLEQTQGIAYDDEDYEGYTLYTPRSEFGSTYVGVVEEGVYVIGTENAVKDALEVQAGEEDGINDELLSTFEQTDQGLIRTATAFPASELPLSAATDDAPFSLNPVENVEYAGASYQIDGNAVTVSVVMITDSADSARDVSDMMDGARSFAAGSANDDSVKQDLRDASVERNDNRVRVTFDATEDVIETLIEDYSDTVV